MQLFIAEKPDLGRHIAQNLPGSRTKKDGYIEGQGWTVTWVFGHLLGQCPPEDYDPKYKKWILKDLPIKPSKWQMLVNENSGAKKQLKVIKGLLKSCSSVVHAGDPDREGQLIVDELLAFLGNQSPVQRILINATDNTTIQRALQAMEDNVKYFPLYQAALARQRADWLVGMNLTRAYTIQGRSQANYQGVLSLGRVQTPTLAIVVNRDLLIESFVPQKYWSLAARFLDYPSQKSFWTTWYPAEAKGLGEGDPSEDEAEDDESQPDNLSAKKQESNENSSLSRPDWLDAHGRVIRQEKIQEIVAKISQIKEGIVTDYQDKQVAEAPPMPFELNTLQSLIISQVGCSAKDVLDAAQALYEKHSATTYPRSACVYLKEDMHHDASQIFAGFMGIPELSSLVKGTNPQLKSKAWNDKKVTEHHGIIPTLKVPNLTLLSPIEKAVYVAIAKRYLAQFYPDCQAKKVKVEIDLASYKFRATGRTILSPGWRLIYQGTADESDLTEDKSTGSSPADTDNALLPALTIGAKVQHVEDKVKPHETTPPPRFTEGTLLTAMKNISQLVDDPVEKKKLKAVSGIGQPATRTPIIDTLKKRGFLKLEKKHLISTLVARFLISNAPPALTKPSLTARWETVLDNIASGKVPLSLFMQKQEQWVDQLIQTTQAMQFQLGSFVPPPPKYPSGSGSKGANSSGGASGTAKGKPCQQCKTGTMYKRTAKSGKNAGSQFWGCSNYPTCKHTENVK